MKLSPDKSHAYCETQSCYVALNQTEGHCREEHNCSEADCPLEKQLGRPRFGRALSEMAQGVAGLAAKSG